MKIIYPPEYDADKDKVTLRSADPLWPKLAQQEIAALRSILPSALILDIQHIGSTAIPGLTAKPIIDIAVAVQSLAQAAPFPALVKPLGYLYLPVEDMPDRLLLVKGLPPFGAGRTHHLHIVEYNGPQWRDWIIFRDYLLNHPQVAEDYAELKHDLYTNYGGKREVYTMGKTKFIEEALRNAGKG